MSITRINTFEARANSEDRLGDFLASVIAIIRECPGCLSCRLLQGAEDPAQFAIIEEWESIEAHRQAARAIPPAMMAEAISLFAHPPTGAYYRD